MHEQEEAIVTTNYKKKNPNKQIYTWASPLSLTPYCVPGSQQIKNIDIFSLNACRTGCLKKLTGSSYSLLSGPSLPHITRM